MRPRRMRCWAWRGRIAPEVVAEAFGSTPGRNSVVTIAGGTARLIRLPDDRFLIVAMAEAEGDIRRALGTRVVAGDAALWRWMSDTRRRAAHHCSDLRPVRAANAELGCA